MAHVSATSNHYQADISVQGHDMFSVHVLKCLPDDGYL